MAYFRYIMLGVLVTTMAFHAVSCTTASALLRPLTPIAGTNLFLNTVYKWHDRTRPGCFATWFTETYSDFSGRWKGVSIVCNEHDHQWYDTPDANWIFERTFGTESTNIYGGTVKIRNVGADSTLETWRSSGIWWIGLGHYDESPSHDMWYVRSDPNNKNNVQLDIQNWFLTQRLYEPHRAYLALKMGDSAGFPYSFVPDIALETRMYDFQFIQPTDSLIAMHSTRKDMMESVSINNDSPGTISRTFTISEKVTDEYSWGFSESIKLFSKATGKTGVPYIGQGELEVGTELTFTALQNWKKSIEKTIQMSYVVNVPPQTRVKVSAWYELIKDLSMDYTASSEITGTISRITDFDDIVKDSRATGEMIRKHLEYSNFDGKIVEIKEFSVIVQIKGVMVASVGARGQLSVNGVTKALADTTRVRVL